MVIEDEGGYRSLHQALYTFLTAPPGKFCFFSDSAALDSMLGCGHFPRTLESDIPINTGTGV
jgi:hypothetical protein